MITSQLLALGRVIVFHSRDVRSYVRDVLLVLHRCPDVLGRFKLIVDDRVLLGSPDFRWFGFDVLDPAFDGLDALLTVPLVLLVEGPLHVELHIF